MRWPPASSIRTLHARSARRSAPRSSGRFPWAGSGALPMWPARSCSSSPRRRLTSPGRPCTSTAACTCRRRGRWTHATGLRARRRARGTSRSVSPVKTITRTGGRRVAAPGVFPYNTAPATGLTEANGGQPLKSLHKDQSLMSTVEQQVKAIVAEQLGVKQEQVTNDASFVDDLGADSLDTVELVMALEEEFEIEIPDEDAEKITTVQQAVDYITERRSKS